MKERDKQVWERFIHLLSLQTFGEKEVDEGKKQKNLFGSIEAHRQVFEEAVDQIDIQEAFKDDNE